MRPRCVPAVARPTLGPFVLLLDAACRVAAWNLLAPAPAGIPAPPDIAQNLRQRIALDAGKLGSAAQKLLLVQSDINRVDKEVTGKVFDLESVRNFVATE